MPDQSINLMYDQQGELERITKTIGDKELNFRFDGHKAVHIGTDCFNGRLNSVNDIWIPKNQFIAACRQATAIFKSKHINKIRQPQFQPSLSH
ncbi:MAG: hypothetical protein Q8N22_01875 [bacterium]|nr:hypothetical protein [bacterium]